MTQLGQLYEKEKVEYANQKTKARITEEKVALNHFYVKNQGKNSLP